MKPGVDDEDLIQRTREEFEPLVREFGFEEPEAERLGYELYVRYHRRADTVSIVFDPYNVPLIEVFAPVEGTSNAPVPWASRNGVQRYRRFPKVGVSELWDPQNAANLGKFLRAFARAFMSSELEFLESASPGSPPN